MLEELAIEEMVGDAPVLRGRRRLAAGEDLTADVATTADVLTADGDVATVEASVTDEGVAAPEAPADTDDAAIATGATVDAEGASSAAPTDDRRGRQRAVRLAGRAARPRSTGTTASPSPSCAAGSAATRSAR